LLPGLVGCHSRKAIKSTEWALLEKFSRPEVESAFGLVLEEVSRTAFGLSKTKKENRPSASYLKKEENEPNIKFERDNAIVTAFACAKPAPMYALRLNLALGRRKNGGRK
jgi:hypothetical protein